MATRGMYYDPELGREVPIPTKPTGSEPDAAARLAAYNRWKATIEKGGWQFPDQSGITTKSPVGDDPGAAQRIAAFNQVKDRIDRGEGNFPDQSGITTKSPIGGVPW